MNENLKTLVKTLLGLALLALVAIGAYFGVDWQGPAPAPQDPPPAEEPAPVPAPAGNVKALQPIEQIAHVAPTDWKREITREAPEGATVPVVIDLGERRCESLTLPAGATARVLIPTQLDVPSFTGGKTGTFYEWMPPLNAATCGLSPYRLVRFVPAAAGAYELGLADDKAVVRVARAPAPRRIPFYMGVQNNYLILGHCPAYCAMEAELGQKYLDAARGYGLTPIGAWAIFPPVSNGRLNLDQGGAYSFRTLFAKELQGGGRVEFPSARLRGLTMDQRRAYYRALEATIQAEGLRGRAWIYLWDEPHSGDYVALLDEANLARTEAPSADLMVTAALDPAISGPFRIHSPVYNWFGRSGKPAAADYLAAGKEFWPYPSCMGSCGVNRMTRDASGALIYLNAPKVPGSDTQLADLLIDRPASFTRVYVEELRATGATGGLYYSAVEGYRLVRPGINLLVDPWNFGGNGDGLLMVPGRPGEFGLTTHEPIPGFRLVVLQAALEGVR